MRTHYRSHQFASDEEVGFGKNAGNYEPVTAGRKTSNPTINVWRVEQSFTSATMLFVDFLAETVTAYIISMSLYRARVCVCAHTPVCRIEYIFSSLFATHCNVARSREPSRTRMCRIAKLCCSSMMGIAIRCIPGIITHHMYTMYVYIHDNTPYHWYWLLVIIHNLDRSQSGRASLMKFCRTQLVSSSNLSGWTYTTCAFSFTSQPSRPIYVITGINFIDSSFSAYMSSFFY